MPKTLGCSAISNLVCRFEYSRLLYKLTMAHTFQATVDVTPMKLQVTAYITKHIQAQRNKDNQRVKPTVYGEVLTSDEVMERLQEEEREKAEKEAEKEKKAAERKAKAAEKVAKKAASTTTKRSKGRLKKEQRNQSHRYVANEQL